MQMSRYCKLDALVPKICITGSCPILSQHRLQSYAMLDCQMPQQAQRCSVTGAAEIFQTLYDQMHPEHAVRPADGQSVLCAELGASQHRAKMRQTLLGRLMTVHAVEDSELGHQNGGQAAAVGCLIRTLGGPL